MGGFFWTLIARGGQYADCTVLTCPVSDSIYGYYPSKPVTLLFIALFGISFIAHLIQGIKYRSWTFLLAFGIGAFGETIGYVGRVKLRNDPFSRSALGMQLVPLTVAPAFLAGGIYLTMKHIIVIYGTRFSRVAPKYYTWIFIFCDIVSIVIQTIGAALAAVVTNPTTGNDVMMVGLVSQVITLAIFGCLAAEVFFRIRRFRGQFNESTNILRGTPRFKRFLIALVVAYLAIFIRCIYRIAEMSGGWRNPIMQNQVAFIILDGIMCLVAVFLLNFCHPGFLFRQSYETLKIESSSSTE